jgi:hypothetical protein
MLAEALVALASLAGNAVVTAASTDAWEAVRHRFAVLLGRGNLAAEQKADERLEETRQLLAGTVGADLERARTAQAERWTARLGDLLEEDPGAEGELRTLVREIQAAAPAGTVSALDHSVAAGGDVHNRADRGAVAATVIHGNVTPFPTTPDPATS